MNENDQWKGIVHMMQHLIGDLQEQTVRHNEEIRALQQAVYEEKIRALHGRKKEPGHGRPCKFCGLEPRMDGRNVCLKCLQRYEFGLDLQ